MEQFDREKKYSPKKRHGNRKPVVPVYSKPNSVRVLNAALRLTQMDEGTFSYNNARDALFAACKAIDDRAEEMVNVINYLDNQID